MSIDSTSTTPAGTAYADAARDHLWIHFTRHSAYEEGGKVPVIVRGEGHKIWDDKGKEYIDGLAGLFVVQVGHGRQELADAAAISNVSRIHRAPPPGLTPTRDIYSAIV